MNPSRRPLSSLLFLCLAMPVMAEPQSRAAQVAGQSDAFAQFFGLGVHHIGTGYDHIVFLLGLLMACATWREMGWIVTCFTAAHSLTLALATLDWIRLAPSLVEPVIALSIVFVAIENLGKTRRPLSHRFAATFLFGLAHGLGFASVLRDLGVGQGEQAFWLPLLAFNLGVEAGQVVLASVCLPVFFWLAKRDAWTRYGYRIASGAIGLLGLYWFVERLVS